MFVGHLKKSHLHGFLGLVRKNNNTVQKTSRVKAGDKNKEQEEGGLLRLYGIACDLGLRICFFFFWRGLYEWAGDDSRRIMITIV